MNITGYRQEKRRAGGAFVQQYFFANYSDCLTNVRLDEMIDTFKRRGKIACFLAIHPPLTYHLAGIDPEGNVRIAPINGGYFTSRHAIFDYINEGEELVLEPFTGLIAEN
jgi:glucose-1-phosphate cytidylyltransferase